LAPTLSPSHEIIELKRKGLINEAKTVAEAETGIGKNIDKNLAQTQAKAINNVECLQVIRG
jgi:hypothetical protein